MAKKSYVKVKGTFLLPIDKSNLTSVVAAGTLVDNVKKALRDKGAVITQFENSLVTPAKDPVDMDAGNGGAGGEQQEAAE